MVNLRSTQKKSRILLVGDNWYLRQQKRRGFGFFISLYTLAGLTSFGVYIDLPYHKHIAVAIGTLLLSSSL